MSTSPDLSRRGFDDLVAALSHWLAGHLPDEQLLAELERVGTELGPDEAALVEELAAELRDPSGRPGERSMLARETIQILCFGT
jgi:hypothetical protein